jgi:neutral amino acid transport system ATP-binding protein
LTDDILTVNAVSKSFAGVQAVTDASFAVRRATLTALIGPNGAGKSTMFDIISGFTPADAGGITLNGRQVAGHRPDRLSRLGLTRIFQSTRVFGRLSVLDNVILGARSHPAENLWRRTVAPRQARRAERRLAVQAEALLEVAGLAHLTRKYAATLSGGQRKLLELARALMADPEILLLDEPAAGVHPALANQIVDYVTSLTRDRGLTCLLVEHNMKMVMSRSDHVVVMNNGSVICDGPPSAVSSDPTVIDAYLGGAPVPRDEPAGIEVAEERHG